MQFNKLIFSVIALAAVSVSATPSSSSTPAKPLSDKAFVAQTPAADAAEACVDWCPEYCGELGYTWFECCGTYVFLQR